MNVSELLKSIGDQIQSAGARKIYGDPVSAGDRTVIPVARVKFGFGAGGGSQAGENGKPEQGGGGGGGGGQVSPVGVVEITPAGTRFIPIRDGRGLVLIAFCLGFLAGRRRARQTAC